MSVSKSKKVVKLAVVILANLNVMYLSSYSSIVAYLYIAIILVGLILALCLHDREEKIKVRLIRGVFIAFSVFIPVVYHLLPSTDKRAYIYLFEDIVGVFELLFKVLTAL